MNISGIQLLLPRTISPGTSEVIDLAQAYPLFPIELSPLRESVSINPMRPFIAFTYADNYEQREPEPFTQGHSTVRFAMIISEESDSYAPLQAFLEEVGCHKEFLMSFPTFDDRLWFQDQPETRNDVGYKHWRYNFNWKTQRAPRVV